MVWHKNIKIILFRKNMKNLYFVLITGLFFMISSCNKPVTSLTYENPDKRILFLHHSTGMNVWYGDIDRKKKFYLRKSLCLVPRLMKEYNEKTGKKLSLEERNFPSGKPYPWKNYPYDYYNIWVKNAGDKPYMDEPTLETLTKDYDIIIFKHCFPVSKILEDDQNPDINSEAKTVANYKLQYLALKEKLKEFPGTRFIVWTGAALVEPETNEAEATRVREFYNWVRETWDNPGDNIELFDFREIETEGGLYLKKEYAVDPEVDSHPNKKISIKAARSLVDKIIEVAEK
jgi:hypothetical protein